MSQDADHWEASDPPRLWLGVLFCGLGAVFILLSGAGIIGRLRIATSSDGTMLRGLAAPAHDPLLQRY